MSPWRARLAVAAVFVAGFLAGAATLHAVRLRFETRLLNAPDAVARIAVYKLNQELRLTREQRQTVYLEVIGARAELLDAIRPALPRIVEIMDGSQARIRATLDDGQKAKWDRLVSTRRRLFQSITAPK